LKYGLFTRDIDECIVIAKKESIDLGQQLNDIRFFLEQRLEFEVDIKNIVKHLKLSFDNNY
jgi:hypothetical protein